MLLRGLSSNAGRLRTRPGYGDYRCKGTATMCARSTREHASSWEGGDELLVVQPFAEAIDVESMGLEVELRRGCRSNGRRAVAIIADDDLELIQIRERPAPP